MFDPGGTYFPDAFVNLLAEAVIRIDPQYYVVRRPPREQDPHGTVGCYEAEWAPESYEIGGPVDPAIQRYTLAITTMAKHVEEQVGRGLGAYMAKSVRLMLYRDTVLRANLPTLTDTSFGVTERPTGQLQLVRQEYAPMNLPDHFIYMTHSLMWIETRVLYA